jgi:hypothetical protein
MCVFACLIVRAFARDRVQARVSVHACAVRLNAPSHRTAGTGGIYSSARGASAAARACLRLVSSVYSRALAAGVTWTSRTTSAPWTARGGHTSVIDAAGVIYVLGGFGIGFPWYNDVWASTNGGA